MWEMGIQWEKKRMPGHDSEESQHRERFDKIRETNKGDFKGVSRKVNGQIGGYGIIEP